MAKDPAALFYTQDFLTGTFTMDDDQVGKYIRLLCIQHQSGNKLTERQITKIMGSAQWDEEIMEKFKKDDEGNYYNVRMKNEGEKRANYTKSRNNNLKGKNQYSKKQEEIDLEEGGHMSSVLTDHMEIENVNEDDNEKRKQKVSKVEAARIFYREQWTLTKEAAAADPRDKVPPSYATFVLTLLNERKGKPNVIEAPGNHILQVPTQISLEQYRTLYAKCQRKGITALELLNSWLNNTNYSKGKKSVYATLLNWANRKPDVERGTNLG